MGKKYIKCPRCELNYILEGEDYCHICKSEMKHFNEGEDNGLLDGFDDVELCPVCGVNYIKEDETMCEECKSKKNQNNLDDEDDEAVEWEKSRDDDSLISYDIDSDSSEEPYNSGFEEIDENSDPYKMDDDTLDDDFAMPIEFSSDDDKGDDKLDEEDEEEEDPFEDDFETIEVSDDEEDEEEDEEEDDDDYYGGMSDMLGKKK